MRAVVCPEFGPLGTLVVEEQSDPVPGEGMVVVDVAAAGVQSRGGLVAPHGGAVRGGGGGGDGASVRGPAVARSGGGGGGGGVGGVDDRGVIVEGFGGVAVGDNSRAVEEDLPSGGGGKGQSWLGKRRFLPPQGDEDKFWGGKGGVLSLLLTSSISESLRL